ncbi:hypothetical protein Goari_003412, partial [Gossypium aridum]|nr:hypothetical protein [Gossypium aridum]
MRAPIATPNQVRGTRRNGVEVFKQMTQSDENKEDNSTNLRNARGKSNAKGKEKVWEEDSEGKSGGLAMMWREGVRVTVQNYSKFHIDSLVKMDNCEVFRFTGGDFNAILNNSEKEGGRRKPKALLDEFCDLMEELSLNDVKTSNGWFTWTKNRDGTGLIKERLNRFFVSNAFIRTLPFLTSNIVRQSKSDHEAILLDLFGCKPKEKCNNPRVCFRYDICWAKEQEARDIVSKAWSTVGCNSLEKMELIKEKLGPWQYKHYRRLRNNIRGLEKDIHNLMDGPINESSMKLLKTARGKLGHLYEMEEKYWA